METPFGLKPNDLPLLELHVDYVNRLKSIISAKEVDVLNSIVFGQDLSLYIPDKKIISILPTCTPFVKLQRRYPNHGFKRRPQIINKRKKTNQIQDNNNNKVDKMENNSMFNRFLDDRQIFNKFNLEENRRILPHSSLAIGLPKNESIQIENLEENSSMDNQRIPSNLSRENTLIINLPSSESNIKKKSEYGVKLMNFVSRFGLSRKNTKEITKNVVSSTTEELPSLKRRLRHSTNPMPRNRINKVTSYNNSELKSNSLIKSSSYEHSINIDM